MAAKLSGKSCVYSSVFARFLRERRPVISCLPLYIQYPVKGRSFHTSDPICGGRLKSEWRRKRAPALTRLCPDKPEKLKTRKAFGGGEKTKVTRVKEGSYIWKSQDIEFKTPILDVLYNEAHKDFTDRKILVRGSVVEVAGEPFKIWYENRNSNFDETKKVMTKEDGEEMELLIDDRILQQLQSGKVLAKVSSRPGQEGKVNGYLLEGKELDKYLKQTRTTDE